MNTFKTLLCIFSLILGNSLSAQKNIEERARNLSEIKVSVSFDHDSQRTVQPGKLRGSSSIDLMRDVTIAVVSGDLVIAFDLPEKAEGYFSIQLDSIQNLRTGQFFSLYPELIDGDLGTKIRAKPASRKSITISNRANNSNPHLLSGPLRIRLSLIHYDYRTARGILGAKVRCEEGLSYTGKIKPNLHFKDGYGGQLTGLILTGGAYGYGLHLDKRFKTIYEKGYRLNHFTRQSAEADYQSANRKYKNSRRWKAVGIVAGSLTAAWWIYETILQKQKKKLYECDCFDFGDCAYFIPERKYTPKLELFSPQAEYDLVNAYGLIGLRLSF